MHQTIKAWILLAVCFCLAGCGGGTPKYPNLSAADREIVAEIEKLGGEVTVEKSGQGDGEIVVEVDLSINPDKPDVTDAALDHVAKLTTLKRLFLTGAAITDGGLAKLSPLTELVTLDISGTKISDAGLIHLKDMKKLENLIARRAAVTNWGEAALKKSLPDVRVTIP